MKELIIILALCFLISYTAYLRNLAKKDTKKSNEDLINESKSMYVDVNGELHECDTHPA